MTSRHLMWLVLLGISLFPLGLCAQEARELFEGEAPQVLESPIQPLDAATVASVCGTASGTRFKLEPRPYAQAQHTTSVAVLRNGVATGVDLVVGAATDARSLHCSVNAQFFPDVRTDRSRSVVNIALYSSGNDATIQHRLRVVLYHINPGGATPDPPEPHTITTALNDPSGNPFEGGFGRSIGVAARGTGGDGQSRAYVHYTYNNIQGTYNGVQVPEANNHLSRLDY